MTFYSRSIIAFGQFCNKVFDNVLSGAPMGMSLELIREQFGASAVVLTVENRDKPSDGNSYIAMAATAPAPRASMSRDSSSLRARPAAAKCRSFSKTATARAPRISVSKEAPATSSRSSVLSHMRLSIRRRNPSAKFSCRILPADSKWRRVWERPKSSGRSIRTLSTVLA